MSSAKTSGGIHYGFIIVFCCCLIMGIDVGLVFSCAGIFYDPVSRTLGVPVGKFGIYMSVSYVASILMLPAAGKLMERHGARKLLTLSSLMLGLCVAAMGMFSSVVEFYAAGAVMGICLAFLLYLSFPILVNAWFRTKVGLMIGICSAASGIGGMLFNPLGGAIITSWGWRAAYLVFGGMILLIVTPLCGLLLRDRPEDKGMLPYGHRPDADPDTSAHGEGTEFGRAVSMPVFYTVMAFAFIMMGVSTLNLFIPKYMTITGFSETDASLAAAAVMAGVTGGKLLLGLINDRNCLLGVLACTLLGVAGIGLLLWGGDRMWVMLAGCFLFGWEYAGVTVQTAMLTGHAFGKKHYTRIYALISIALAAGGALASGGWGLLADATSFRTVFLTGALVLAFGCLLGTYSYLSPRRRAARSVMIAAAVILATACPACASPSGKRMPEEDRLVALRDSLEKIAATSRGETGIAIITDRGDTLTVNNADKYPLMSVFKLHQAIALCHMLEQRGIPTDTIVEIDDSRLNPDTWSPMLRDHTERPVRIPVSELLRYTLTQSDNNASNYMFESIGSVGETDRHIATLIPRESFRLAVTEAEMWGDHSLAYSNHSSPLGTALLIERLFTDSILGARNLAFLRTTLRECTTGNDRIAAPLEGKPGVTVAHKTGSGFRNADGLLSAHNDVAFITLPDGRHYTLAVLVKDFAGTEPEASALIARISALTHAALSPTR